MAPPAQAVAAGVFQLSGSWSWYRSWASCLAGPKSEGRGCGSGVGPERPEGEYRRLGCRPGSRAGARDLIVVDSCEQAGDLVELRNRRWTPKAADQTDSLDACHDAQICEEG